MTTACRACDCSEYNAHAWIKHKCVCSHASADHCDSTEPPAKSETASRGSRATGSIQYQTQMNVPRTGRRQPGLRRPAQQLTPQDRQQLSKRLLSAEEDPVPTRRVEPEAVRAPPRRPLPLSGSSFTLNTLKVLARPPVAQPSVAARQPPPLPSRQQQQQRQCLPGPTRTLPTRVQPEHQDQVYNQEHEKSIHSGRGFASQPVSSQQNTHARQPEFEQHWGEYSDPHHGSPGWGEFEGVQTQHRGWQGREPDTCDHSHQHSHPHQYALPRSNSAPNLQQRYHGSPPPEETKYDKEQSVPVLREALRRLRQELEFMQRVHDEQIRELTDELALCKHQAHMVTDDPVLGELLHAQKELEATRQELAKVKRVGAMNLAAAVAVSEDHLRTTR